MVAQFPLLSVTQFEIDSPQFPLLPATCVPACMHARDLIETNKAADRRRLGQHVELKSKVIIYQEEEGYSCVHMCFIQYAMPEHRS